MLPTLKSKYEQHAILSESLDTDELKKMNKLLDELSVIIKQFKLPELKKGLEKATEDLANSIGGNWQKLKRVGAGKDGVVKANPKKLAKVASFQTSLIKGLKQMPEIIGIISNIANSPTNEEEALQHEFDSIDASKPSLDDALLQVTNESVSIADMMNKKALDRLKGIMLNAFSPPGFLAMFRGMPYVDDNKVIEELLELSKEDFLKIVSIAKRINLQMPIEKKDFSDIAKKAKEQAADDESIPDTIEIQPKEKQTTTKKAEDSEEQQASASSIVVNDFTKKVKAVFPDADAKKIKQIVDYLSNRGVTFK